VLKCEDKLSRLTWNIMAVPTALLPAPGVAIGYRDERELHPANQRSQGISAPAVAKNLGGGRASLGVSG
jgi:hypothetical protein